MMMFAASIVHLEGLALPAGPLVP